MQLEGGVNSNRIKLWLMALMTMKKDKNITHHDLVHEHSYNAKSMGYHDLARNQHLAQGWCPYTASLPGAAFFSAALTQLPSARIGGYSYYTGKRRISPHCIASPSV